MKWKTQTCLMNNIRLMLFLLHNELKTLMDSGHLLDYWGLRGYINEDKYRCKLCFMGLRWSNIRKQWTSHVPFCRIQGMLPFRGTRSFSTALSACLSEKIVLAAFTTYRLILWVRAHFSKVWLLQGVGTSKTVEFYRIYVNL